MTMTEDELLQRTQSELQSGEQLVWQGQPIPRRMAMSGPMIFVLIFGTFFTGFSICWILGAALIMTLARAQGNAEGLWVLFPLFGIPFLIIGIGILSIPYLRYRSAKRMSYAITNLRAITWLAGVFGGVVVQSYKPVELTKIVRRDYSDGSGDLIFRTDVRDYVDDEGFSRSSSMNFGFLAIANVREIEKLIQKHLTCDNR